MGLNVPSKSVESMSDQTNSENPKIPVGSPYCSDPNCPYCKELQEVTEEVRKSNASPTFDDGAIWRKPRSSEH
jgi:3-methyladenine DNA glycosylase AlkC